MTLNEKLIAGVRLITDSHASAEQPLATMTALDAAVEEVVGRKLLTVLAVRAAEGIVERMYSNLSQSYAAGETKSIDSAPRLQKVLASGKPFIGRNRGEIAANYSDAETIFAAGCSSILNVPVVWGGTILATVNLLNLENYYRDEHIPLVQCLAQAAAPAFLYDRSATSKHEQSFPNKEEHHV